MNRSLIPRSKQSIDLFIRRSTSREAQASMSQHNFSSPLKRRYHPSPTLFSSQPKSSSSSSQPQSSKRYTQNEPMKAAPFSELGATKTVKVVVIIAISIIATMETLAYARWAYAWWYREKEVVEEDNDNADEWWERK